MAEQLQVKLKTPQIVQKHDVEENWLKAENFYPLKGQIIVYDPDDKYDYPRVKVGIWDGESEKTEDMLVSNLPFANGYTNEEIEALLKNLECESFTVRDSDGDNIFSIAEGTRITGGSTNKDMITEMVGSLGSLTVDLQEAQAHQDMSMAFGANSDTYGAGTVSFGVNTSAGTMAYYWDEITFGDKPTIQLSTTRRASTWSNPSYPSSVDWEKGDRVTIKTKDSNWVLAGTIESISGNVITLDAALPFTDIGYTSTLTVFTYAMPHDRTIHNIDKPESGVISIGFGAIAMGGGYENKTRAPGMLSLALGYETLAAGSMAVAAGKNTEAGYASLAIGAEAKALGETSLAVGTKTKATGAYAIAGGQSTEAAGSGAVALGVGSKATKWTALAAGSTAVAEGNAAISLGNNTQATAEGAVALGYITRATAAGALAQGQRTVASGEGAHAEGNFSQATATAAHAEGGGENADVATKATAAYAHAEGYRTIAGGSHSHTEGAKTETRAGSAHAEGEGTIATQGAQHVQGKYNFLDENGSAGNYAHIIGNGSESNRKNIHTVDWSGNAWYAGKVETAAGKLITLGEARTYDIGAKTSSSGEIFNAAKDAGPNAHAEGQGTDALGRAAHAEGYQTHAPGSHSHAEGALTEAVGSSSHAEGEGSVARGTRSNAGGYNTHAIGVNSFAFGENTQTGSIVTKITSNNLQLWCSTDAGMFVNDSSKGGFIETAKAVRESSVYPFTYNDVQYKVHIIGDGCEVYWNGEHSEYSDAIFGYWLYGEVVELTKYSESTYDSYDCTFECDPILMEPTYSGGTNSVAFGNHTQAASSNQFVAGRYNIVDTTGNYAFIIGNGSNSIPSNAMTLDWSGNGQFKGDVKAGDIGLMATSTLANNAKTTADTALDTATFAKKRTAITFSDPNKNTMQELYETGALGLDARETARYGMALGWGCKVTGDHGMAFGACTWAQGGQTAVGKANDPEKTYANGKTAIFMVGNGVTNAQANATIKSNAFAVTSDGVGYLGDKRILTEDYKFTSIKIGETEFTEEQLKKIIDFIDSIGYKGGNA